MASSLETHSSSLNYWAIVPAAGVGSRMNAGLPKQYLPLCGEAVISHTLKRLAKHPAISGLMVAVSENDTFWDELDFELDKPLYSTQGGSERCYSVLNALRALANYADDNDWVLVHDAARPCVRSEDIHRLIDSLKDDVVGGLLAMPVKDTMKRATENHSVIDTVDRSNMWHAFTPQMFRLGMLREALERAIENNDLVTDEASAIELSGLQPRLIEGHADNIKITRPEDLVLAEFYLQQQEQD
ncbi:MAG: 2-C-methyl-D-erythritol 4-phosphate cytidylyltransferase [Gammaproteobacteria bacterium]|nr:2-C-methyl-D-erythritol 4-phosphate cytidylyltransferase [Gammaproteobacteria bacterium]